MKKVIEELDKVEEVLVNNYARIMLVLLFLVVLVGIVAICIFPILVLIGVQ